MQDTERKRLEYRPRFRYVPDLQSVLNQNNLPEKQTIYKLPTALTQALENPSANALDGALKAKDKANGLVTALKSSLVGDSLDERHHRNDLDGKVQFEALQVLEKTKDQLEQLVNRITDSLFPGRTTDDLDTLYQTEVDEIDSAIQTDMKGKKQDLAKWQMRAHLARLFQEQADNLNQFIDDLDGICRYTINDQLNGNVTDAIQSLATAPTEALTVMTLLMEQRLGQTVVKADRARLRLERLDTEQMRDTLLLRFHQKQEIYNKTIVPLTEWIKGVDTNWDTHPVTSILNVSLEQIEYVLGDLQSTIVELKKLNTLERMNRDDFTESLLAKKQVRQTHKLVKDLTQDFDPTNSARDQQVRLFIEDHALNVQGSISS